MAKLRAATVFFLWWFWIGTALPASAVTVVIEQRELAESMLARLGYRAAVAEIG